MPEKNLWSRISSPIFPNRRKKQLTNNNALKSAHLGFYFSQPVNRWKLNEVITKKKGKNLSSGKCDIRKLWGRNEWYWLEQHRYLEHKWRTFTQFHDEEKPHRQLNLLWHRACLITTFQDIPGKNNMYNQIDYINLLRSQTQSMMAEKSHNRDRIDSDHRSLVSTMQINTAFRLDKYAEKELSRCDGKMKTSSGQKKSIWQKTYQSNNISNFVQSTKKRTILERKVKVGQADTLEHELSSWPATKQTKPATFSKIMTTNFMRHCNTQ